MASIRTSKIWIVVFMVIYLVLGCVLIGVGSWSVHEFKAYAALSPSVPYESAPALIVAAGMLILVVVLLFCAAGCWETPQKNRCGFIVVFLFLLVTLGLEISGAVLGYKHGDKIENTLSDDVVKTIRELYGIEKDPSSALDALQENRECCGWYNYTDWRDSRFAREVTVLNESVVPDSCCVKGPKERFHCGRQFSVNNIYTKGCQGAFMYKLIRDKLYSVAVTAIIAIVFQVPGMLLLLLLILKQESLSGECDEPICRSGFWREFFED
ncbi:tetraspanin-9-like [Oculina patagonica]